MFVKNYFRKYHLFFGIIGAGTLTYDFARNVLQIINYFSAFTILNLVITSVVFIYIGLSKKEKVFGLTIDVVRGAVVCYLLVAALIYTFFLANTTIPNRVVWVDIVIHKILPAAGLLGWIIFPPRKKVKYRTVLGWVVFPVAYFIYLLIRGAFTNWYPYYFFDPRQNGYFPVIVFSLKMVVFGLIGSLAVIAVGNLLGDIIRNKK